MIRWIVDFMWNKQTFASMAGDMMAAGAVVAASPDATETLVTAFGPWATLAIPALAYAGGVVSGKKTGN